MGVYFVDTGTATQFLTGDLEICSQGPSRSQKSSVWGSTRAALASRPAQQKWGDPEADPARVNAQNRRLLAPAGTLVLNLQNPGAPLSRSRALFSWCGAGLCTSVSFAIGVELQSAGKVHPSRVQGNFNQRIRSSLS